MLCPRFVQGLQLSLSCIQISALPSRVYLPQQTEELSKPRNLVFACIGPRHHFSPEPSVTIQSNCLPNTCLASWSKPVCAPEAWKTPLSLSHSHAVVLVEAGPLFTTVVSFLLLQFPPDSAQSIQLLRLFPVPPSLFEVLSTYLNFLQWSLS